jgi:hydroxymethylpyrimidine kinase/phosphomethylpyrimidine kinase/thiamine-phosphate diphosphorylase
MTELIQNKPIIWTISGSDCSGGAGIAADIKTGHALGVEVCHLITANTVQNSQKLLAVNPVSSEILAQQATLLLEDKTPSVIKIGLLVTIEQVTWLSMFLAQLNSKKTELMVIYDPVGQASVGGKFSSLTVADLLPLLKHINIITPNAMEAQQLAQSTSTGRKKLANIIMQYGINSVIIKGGHSFKNSDYSSCVASDHDRGMDRGNDEVNSLVHCYIDTLKESHTVCLDYCLHQLTDLDSSKMSQEETMEYGLESDYINTHYSHGCGCSFASALAANIAHGYLLRDAFTLSKAFIHQGLMFNQEQTKQYGAFEQTHWPEQAINFPRIRSKITQKYKKLAPFQSLNTPRGSQEKLGLYPVIDSLYWLKRLLPLNLNIIQLRVKNKSQVELENIIEEAIQLCEKAKKNGIHTRLFINDYWQLAIKYGAYGVHIGQEDLYDADLDKIQQAGLRLGISTHGCYEFLLAQQLQPSYLAIGAIFPTKTKNMTGQIQGVKNLRDTLNLATHIPVVAIGGINHDRAVGVLATGVDSIAVVTAITEANNPEGSVAEFQKIIHGQG